MNLFQTPHVVDSLVNFGIQRNLADYTHDLKMKEIAEEGYWNKESARISGLYGSIIKTAGKTVSPLVTGLTGYVLGSKGKDDSKGNTNSSGGSSSSVKSGYEIADAKWKEIQELAHRSEAAVPTIKSGFGNVLKDAIVQSTQSLPTNFSDSIPVISTGIGTTGLALGTSFLPLVIPFI